MADRFRLAEELFHRALEQPPEDREAWLAAAAGDDRALLAEVESLLAAGAERPGFLDDPAAAVAFAGAGTEPEPAPPPTIGPFRLLREIGRGGMGRVYLAEQEAETFRRPVAIKLLRESGLLAARFRSEQRILAALEHPGIARLYDAGTTADGRLFLALEYVEGRDLVTHAREKALPLAERLRLFGEVCAAVEYAHRHLVVHRDLKPANILVTASGEPKLLDFGIAKLLQPEGGAAAETVAALRWMTPEYASPEQIRGEPISTGSDVYSLGVILFELLTGERPYRWTGSDPGEVSRAVLEQEPRRPSTAVGSGPGVAGIERRRLRGDLDTIVLRALAKDPARRYSGAAALADDLRRHLEGRPVAAQPDRLAYRTGKFVRRHRVAVAAGALAALSLVAGLGLAVWQARIARAERDRARVEAARANETAAFLASLFENADPGRTRGVKLTMRDVLDRGAGRLERDLAAQPEIQATLLALIGSVYRELGLLDPARETLERARAVAEGALGSDALATARALHELAALERVAGNLEAGRRAAERALEIRERQLGPDHLEVARTVALLGGFDRLEGERDASQRRFSRALAIAARDGVETTEIGKWLNNQGLIYQDAGELEPARRAFERSLAILERNEGPDSPLLAVPLDNLGMVQRVQGDLAAALATLERGSGLVERGWGAEHPQYGTALNSLGNVLLDLGRHAEARERFRASRANYEAALGVEHPYVAWPLTNEGLALLGLERPGEALPLLRRALAIREASHGEEHWESASSRADVGRALAQLGDRAGAEAELSRAVAIGRRVIVPPTVALADLLVPLADFLAADRREAEARPLYLEALPIYRAAYPRGHATIARLERSLAALATPPAR